MKPAFLSSVVLFAGALFLGGCANGGSGSDVIMSTPANWQEFENKTIKVQGDAANSPYGPFVRLRDGTSLKLAGMKPWAIDFITRPVGIEGKIVKGTDAFADRYVLQVEKYYRVQTDQQPITIAPPEPEKPNIPHSSSSKKKDKEKDKK